jgi:hypothetical protein
MSGTQMISPGRGAERLAQHLRAGNVKIRHKPVGAPHAPQENS